MGVQLKHTPFGNDLYFLNNNLVPLMWSPCFYRENRVHTHRSGCNTGFYTALQLSVWIDMNQIENSKSESFEWNYLFGVLFFTVHLFHLSHARNLKAFNYKALLWTPNTWNKDIDMKPAVSNWAVTLKCTVFVVMSACCSGWGLTYNLRRHSTGWLGYSDWPLGPPDL